MSVFATPDDAKQFLLERVRRVAAQQGMELTEVEQYMFGFSVMDEEIDDALHEKFDRSYSMPEFEAKIRDLLQSAYDEDLKSPSGDAALWRSAHDLLRRGDHYLLMMLAPVVKPGLLARLCAAFGH